MNLDVRYPIGLLLMTYGVILGVQGTLVGSTVTGINVDLYWGSVMTLIGAGALYLARRRR